MEQSWNRKGESNEEARSDPVKELVEMLHGITHKPVPSDTLEPIFTSSSEFALIEKFFSSTKAEKIMDIVQIYRIRHPEMSPQLSNSNRHLLWHGTSFRNVGGILRDGLLIAPEEAKPNGARHGKGCYFADMSAKASHYCWHASAGDEGILFLGDVALGNVQEEKKETFSNPLREGFDSVKALGRRFPDPAGDMRHPEGYIVPMGQAIVEGDYSREFCEYIVYSTPQVRLRYLVRARMHWAHSDQAN